jgi:hypothetical protein
VMNSPKTLNVNFSIDYGLLIFPLIVAAGIVGEVVILVLRRRRRAQVTLGPSTDRPTCPNCGEAVEEEWTHCIHCGGRLRFMGDSDAEL